MPYQWIGGNFWYNSFTQWNYQQLSLVDKNQFSSCWKFVHLYDVARTGCLNPWNSCLAGFLILLISGWITYSLQGNISVVVTIVLCHITPTDINHKGCQVTRFVRMRRHGIRLWLEVSRRRSIMWGLGRGCLRTVEYPTIHPVTSHMFGGNYCGWLRTIEYSYISFQDPISCLVCCSQIYYNSDHQFFAGVCT